MTILRQFSFWKVFDIESLKLKLNHDLRLKTIHSFVLQMMETSKLAKGVFIYKIKMCSYIFCQVWNCKQVRWFFVVVVVCAFFFSQKAHSLFSKKIKFLMCIYVLPARTCVLYVYLVCRNQYSTSGSLEMKIHMVLSCHVGNGDWALVLYMKSKFSAAGPPLHLITYWYCYLEKNFLFLKAKECCSSSKHF